MLGKLRKFRLLDDSHQLTPWVVCFSAAFFFFYEFIQMNMFNAINTDLMRDFNISAKMLGNLSSTYFYADVIFLFPAGILLDRLSTRKIILCALGICILGTFFFATAKNFWFASLCHFASGIGNAFCFLSCMMLASRWFPPKKLALVTGLIVTFAMAGGAMAQTPFVILTHHVGWRHAVLVNACLGLFIFVVVWLFVYDRPLKSQVDYGHNLPDEQVRFWTSIFLALKNTQNWFCGLYTSFLNLPLMVLGGLWGSLYLTQVHNFTTPEATTISSMLFIGTIVGSPVFGAISDRMGRRVSPMIFGAILSWMMAMLLIYYPHLNYFSAIILFLFLGFFTSAQIIGYPVITESNPKQLTGTSLGIASMLIMGGAGLCQQIFGYLIDLHWNHAMLDGTPLYSVGDFHMGMVIFPITLVIALILAALIKETYCRTHFN